MPTDTATPAAYQPPPPDGMCTCGHCGGHMRVLQADGSYLWPCRHDCGCKDFTGQTVSVTVELTPQQYRALEALRFTPSQHGAAKTPADVLAYLAASATDGLRRSGSWEASWLQMAFGAVTDASWRTEGLADESGLLFDFAECERDLATTADREEADDLRAEIERIDEELRNVRENLAKPYTP